MISIMVSMILSDLSIDYDWRVGELEFESEKSSNEIKSKK